MNTIGLFGQQINNTSAEFLAEANNSVPQSRKGCPLDGAVTKMAGWLSHLIDPDQVVELRAVGVADVPLIEFANGGTKKPTYIGTFRGTELESLAHAGLEMSGRANVYITSNPLLPARYQRQAPRLQKSSRAAEDRHVQDRRRLLLDIDRPKHLRKAAATAEQMERLLGFTHRVRDYLTAEGFPSAAKLCSGNGFYLRYRHEPLSAVDYQQGDTNDLIRRVLEHLADKFDDDDGEVDTGVYNPSRIYRLAGTLNIKHAPPPDGAYPRVRLIDAPTDREEVPLALLRELASRAPTAARKVAVAVPGSKRAAASAPVCVSGTTTVDAHLDRRIRGYMAKVPVCVADAGGDDQLFEAACHLVRGFSISPAAAYPYLAEYNGRCLPPWNDDRLWHKLTQAEGSSIREPGYLLSRERESQPRGYDNLTPAEAAEIFARHQAEPLAPPEPCPHAAAAEVLEMLEPTCQCANPRMMIGKRPSTGRRGVVPFGCHRDRCPRCGGQKRHDLFDGTQSYILRRTAADAPGGPMSLHARVIPADREEAVKDYVRAHNGKYLIIPTADPAGCREHLDPDLRQGRGAPCLKSGSGGASLCLVLMPTGMVAPPDLAGGDVSPAGTAGVFRAIGNALTTPVKPPAGVKRVRSWMKSRDWGDKPPREPGDFVPEGQSRFKKDTPEIVEEIGIDSPFPFADPTIVGEAVGLDAGPAQSLAVSLLLRGVVGLRGPKKKDQVIRPEKDQVIRLGQDWIKAIPADVGDGPRVENVLRLQLWRGPNDGIVDRLREAARLDAEQRDAELPRQAELGSLLKSFDRLLWSYCGREHAAGPVLSCLIEPLQRTRRWRKLRKMLARPQPTLNA